MLIIAITGGVASGKSSVAKQFGEAVVEMDLPSAFFDADAEVHLLLTDPNVLETLRSEFGQAVLAPAGQVNRAWLRQVVFSDAEARKRLEGILHPMVRERAKAFLAEAKANAVALAFLEIPLLYEVDFPLPRDMDVVVAVSSAEQRRRLRELRGLTDKQADQVLAAQLPISVKIEKAHTVIWNDLKLKETKEQVWLACRLFRSMIKE